MLVIEGGAGFAECVNVPNPQSSQIRSSTLFDSAARLVTHCSIKTAGLVTSGVIGRDSLEYPMPHPTANTQHFGL